MVGYAIESDSENGKEELKKKEGKKLGLMRDTEAETETQKDI